jgi:CLIP-associating protein 1/2
MEDQAQTLLVALKKPSLTADAKLQQFNTLKSSIKQQRVPEPAQLAIFECVRIAISAQTSPTLVSTGFATLGHLVKRLTLQEQTAVISAQSSKLLPILQERLGDARESIRNAASQSLHDLWPFAKVDVEKVIREGALAGHNARSKEAAMMWIVRVCLYQPLSSLDWS